MTQLAIPENTIIEHLSNQFALGLPILFTGAGFSLAAKNQLGSRVPSVWDLSEDLWKLSFPDEPFDGKSALQDLYGQALARQRNALTGLLRPRFTVNANTLPEWYRTIFGAPWARAYTVNVDDLARAAGRKFSLPRAILETSATSGSSSGAGAGRASKDALEVVHLNGFVDDIPDGITFSPLQYAERLAQPDAWYMRLSADVLSCPIVFIGTTLNEPVLWQYVQYRRTKGPRGMRELRPRSYLVTPSLDRARQALLTEFNIIWLPFTAEQFVSEILIHTQSVWDAGLAIVKGESRGGRDAQQISEVAALATDPTAQTDFLIGQEPSWSDIQSHRAIERECDRELADVASKALSSVRGVTLVTGTAGSGKSTSLMRLCLNLVADGKRVGWIDRFSPISAHAIRQAIVSATPQRLDVLAVDDADNFGSELSPLLQEILGAKDAPAVICAMRSTKVDKAVEMRGVNPASLTEVSMPPLADADISGLLDVLEKENRLGILKGKSRKEQEQAFRDRAGRQLLVAMIEATSGRLFEEKVVDELFELKDEAFRIYAFVAAATALRYSLRKEELLIALGDQSNATLNAIDRLDHRRVIVRGGANEEGYRGRHRLICDILLNELQKQGQLADIIGGLCWAIGSKLNEDTRRSSREWRFCRTLLNHDFLMRNVGTDRARDIYGATESLLSWQYHYWLQRGSLELECGDLSRAENFLNQAFSLAPDDPYVLNELAYLWFRQAVMNPSAGSSKELSRRATDTLVDLIEQRGAQFPHSYHVLGSQGLAWAKKGFTDSRTKEAYLRLILKHVRDGVQRHNQQPSLKQVETDIMKELLAAEK